MLISLVINRYILVLFSGMLLQKLLRLETKMSWWKMFFCAYRLRWKLELLGYLLIALSLFIITFVTIPELKSYSWPTIVLSLMTGAMIAPISSRVIKFSAVITKKLCIENSNYIPNNDFCNPDGLRILMVKRLLEENNALKEEKIKKIIEIFKFQAGLPQYQFRFLRIFNSFFFLVLGGLMAFVFKLYEKEDLDKVIGMCSSFFVAIVLITAMALCLEKLIFQDLHRTLIKKRYKISLLQYLEEIQLML
jgi:hypothetical protein